MSSSNTIVSSGQTLTGQIFSSGDSVLVEGGGTLQHSTILHGATLVVSGGAADNIALRGGALIDTGDANYVTVTSSGFFSVNDVADHTTLKSGEMSVQGGANHTFVGSQGTLVGDGGFLSNTTIGFGGTLSAMGSVTGAVVSSGGLFTNVGDFFSTGYEPAQTITVHAGGELNEVGGAITGVTIGSGATLLFHSGNVSGTVQSGGLVLLEGKSDDGFPDDNLNGLTIASGGTLALIGGAREGGATLALGVKTISAQAVLTSAVGAASELVLANTHLSGLTVGSGETLYAYSASDIGASIVSGGSEFIYGGRVHDNRIEAGGVQNIGGFVGTSLPPYGGSATNTTVASGGLQVVSGTGAAERTTVEAGGTLEVFGDATAKFVTVDSGGTAYSYGSGLTDVRLAVGGSLAPGFAYAPGATAQLSAQDVLTISAGGETASLQLQGDYRGETFHVSSDASLNATLITLSAATQAAAVAARSGELTPRGDQAAASPPPVPAPLGAALQTPHVEDNFTYLFHVR